MYTTQILSVKETVIFIGTRALRHVSLWKTTYHRNVFPYLYKYVYGSTKTRQVTAWNLKNPTESEKTGSRRKEHRTIADDMKQERVSIQNGRWEHASSMSQDHTRSSSRWLPSVNLSTVDCVRACSLICKYTNDSKAAHRIYTYAIVGFHNRLVIADCILEARTLQHQNIAWRTYQHFWQG